MTIEADRPLGHSSASFKEFISISGMIAIGHQTVGNLKRKKEMNEHDNVHELDHTGYGYEQAHYYICPQVNDQKSLFTHLLNEIPDHLAQEMSQ